MAWLYRHRAAEILRYRDFRLLWFGHVFGSMSFWMDQVTRGWLIYELTDSTVQLGMIRGVQAISNLLAKHCPPRPDNPDELSNRPVIVG